VGESDSVSTIVDERNIPQPALLWRPDFAEHKQQLQIVEAIETATYYRRPLIGGHAKLEAPSRWPARTGLATPATLRGAAVMLAAAGRSGGVTTAITYNVRAGTSTCERVLRISSSAIAIPSAGAKGTSIKQTFDGR
jgi:hypothetical protein